MSLIFEFVCLRISCVTDGKASSIKNKDQSKKRKKVTVVVPEGNKGAGNNKANEGGNEDDDGYKTDEEQWGSNRNADEIGRAHV